MRKFYHLVTKGHNFFLQVSNIFFLPYRVKPPWNIFFVWSSLYRSSPLHALRLFIRLATPVPHYLRCVVPSDRRRAWIAEAERGRRASVEHDSPSILSSLRRTLCLLPLGWTWDRGVCRLWELPPPPPESLGSHWRNGAGDREANRL